MDDFSMSKFMLVMGKVTTLAQYEAEVNADPLTPEDLTIFNDLIQKSVNKDDPEQAYRHLMELDKTGFFDITIAYLKASIDIREIVRKYSSKHGETINRVKVDPTVLAMLNIDKARDDLDKEDDNEN